MESPRPIFVIGRNRSGTKWLSNIIANHESVAAVQHVRGSGSGIVSTNLFDHFPRTFGDLRDSENRSGFLACFAESNFFRHTGLPRQVLHEQHWSDYLELFRYLMGALARKEGKPYWLQKAASLVLPRLHARFPDARFIVIRRLNVLDNIRSSIALHGQAGAKPARPARIVAELASYYLHRSIEQQYLASPNVMLVEFEALKEDGDEVVRSVCRFLDLSYQPALLDVGYSPNTSFAGKVKPADVMSPAGLAMFRLLHPIVRLVPGSLLRASFRLRERSDRRRFSSPRFIRGTFRSFREQEAEQAGPRVSLPGASESEPRYARGEA
jgi:hypothetical protein